MTDTDTPDRVLREFIDAVERLAWAMPPPNPWTPQFIAMVIEARNRRELISAASYNSAAPETEDIRQEP